MYKRRKLITRLVIIVIIIGGIFAYNAYKQKKALENFEASIYMHGVMTPDELADTWKEQDSDIAGMTRYDKYEMGLDIEDGSDTDQDGISDKDEIEIYGSDPLKYSTAGDLYSDGYKIANNLDVNTPIETEDAGLLDYPYNTCSEITLSAETAEELNANIKYVTGTHTVSGADIYVEYKIDYYDSDIKIDLSGILPDGATTENIGVYIIFGNDFSEKASSFPFKAEDDNTIIITQKRGYSHYYLLMGSDNSLKGRLVGAYYELSDILGGGDDTGRLYLVDTYPLLNRITGTHTKIYVCLADGEDEETVENELKEYRKARYPYYNSKGEIAEGLATSDTSFDAVFLTREEIKAKYDEYNTNKIRAFFRADRASDFMRYYLYTYYMCSDMNEIVLGKDINSYGKEYAIDEEEETVVAKGESGFIVGIDNFAFKNFGLTDTLCGSTGNCLGLSFLMTDCYNSYGLNAVATGDYYMEGTEQINFLLDWDINNAGETEKTLLDRGLYDYRGAEYFTSNYGENISLLSVADLSDRGFLNMVAYYQDCLNETQQSFYRKTGSYMDWQIVETMIEIINAGGVVQCGVYTDDGISHAIIIYAYESDKKDSDTYYFKVYDVNFPFESDKVSFPGDNAQYTIDQSLTVHKCYYNGEARFQYEYFPFKNTPYAQTYYAGSDIGTPGSTVYGFNAYANQTGQHVNAARFYGDNADNLEEGEYTGVIDFESLTKE